MGVGFAGWRGAVDQCDNRCVVDFKGGVDTVGKVRAEVIYFTAAVLLLALAVPLMPSSLLLKPQTIIVDDENIIFTRKVTLPVNAHWSVEFERLSPSPPLRLVSCDQSGDAYFEVRDGLPVTFAHGCDFNGEIAAEWELRMCWEVSVATLYMRPVCKTKTFFPHAEELGQQLDSIKLELQQLKEDRP